MRHFLIRIICFALLSSTALGQSADIAIIANTEEPLASLSQQQVRNLYMGIPLGMHLNPVALDIGHPLRHRFNARVVGLTEARIQSYWAQMTFTGRKTPPQTLPSEAALIRYISETPGSIGYVSADSQLPKHLSVLLIAR